MRTMPFRAGISALALVAGCASVPAPVKYTVVLGDSFASTSEAVQEARNAIGTAATVGCKPISIGSGGAGAAVEQGGGLLLNVVVLLECPAGAPELLDTGLPVT